MKNSLIVALDFPSLTEALKFIHHNNLKDVPVKVGMELFYKDGHKVIEKLKQDNHSIFLDLKLHDIPNTVKYAMKNLASLGVDMVNVHASGGRRMIEAAREGLEMGTNANHKRPILLAVTQLTSSDEKMLKNDLGINWSMEKTVVQYGYFASESGADGVVCSVHEVGFIKNVCGDSFLTCTPGIRFLDDQTGDQKRIATPSEAKDAGSDMIVMGRSITRSENPYEQYIKAVKEWENE